MINAAARAAAIAALVIVAGGCSSLLAPQPDLSKFFVLTATSTPVPLAAAPPAAGAGGSLAIGVGPVRLPSYLSGHDEIATRIAPNQIEYSATDRWAEPLDTNFSRTLVKNIVNSLSDVQVVAFPWFKSTPVNYAIEVEVERFERDQNGATQLAARWTIKDGKSGNTVLVQESSIHHDAPSKAAAEAVAALSADVGDLSDQIVAAVRELQEKSSRHARKSGAPQTQ